MAEITEEMLSKKTEYKEIIEHFKKWNTWQRHYFFCQYTQFLDIKILEILMTDFEPLYHSGYVKFTVKDALSKTSINSKSNDSIKNVIRYKRCRIPGDRLYHEHVSEAVFDTKTMADYILKPNPINMEVYGQTMDTAQMKQLFLKELDYMKEIYTNWETYEFIHLIHLLFPFCDKPTLLYLSSCVNKRVYAHDTVLKLPENVVELIVSYLPPKELVNASLVSKTWQKACYKSLSWKNHAMDLNFTGIDFDEFAANSEETIWRRIYIELYELSKQKTIKPRLRFGSIIQSFQSVPEMMAAVDSIRRPSLVPDMLKFTLKTPQLNVSPVEDMKIQPIRYSSSGRRSTAIVTPRRKTIVISRADTRMSHLSHLSSLAEDNEALSSPLPLSQSNSPAQLQVTICPTPDVIVIPVDDVTPTLQDDLPVMRVASVHGSCCQEDEIAYEEVLSNTKRHSQRHVNFIKELTGYSNWMSALATTYPLKRVDELIGHKQPVYTFQADALRVISGCTNGVLRIWDVKTGRPVKRAAVHNGAINSLQFDGHKIVTAGWDNLVKIFSVSSLQCFCVLAGHTDSVTNAFFNKTHLISVSLDKTLRVYLPTNAGKPNQVSYTCEHVIVGHESGITHGDMDDTTIFSGSLDHTIRLWCAKFYNPVRVIHCGAEILHFTFDLGLILASTANRSLVFIDRAKEVPSHRISCGDSDVNYIWLYGSRFITGDTAGLVKEWDLPSGILLRILHGHLGQVYCVQANKSQIISSSYDQSIKIWHLATLKSTDNALE